MFSHNETQVCAKYSPSAKVTTAWNVRDDHETVVDYKVTELDVKVEGVASTSSMNLVYTCQLQSCCIECPCRLCTAQDDCCKLRHRSLLCNKCNPQCNLHGIKVPHVFDRTTDLYTIVTEHFNLASSGSAMDMQGSQAVVFTALRMSCFIKFTTWSNTLYADSAHLRRGRSSS